MASPLESAARPSLVTELLANQDVGMTPEVLSNHQGSNAEYLLRQCRALKETLSIMRTSMTVAELPDPPVHCPLLNGGKSLESRTVVASSSRMGSLWSTLTDSRQPAEDREAEIWAELQKMDERIQEDYQRLLQFRTQLFIALDAARQAETSLASNISCYEKALEREHKDQDQQELQRQLENSEKQLIRAQRKQDTNARVDEKVMNLEKLLREANCRSTEMQRDLDIIREEKAAESKKVEARNIVIAAYQRRTDADHETIQVLTEEIDALSKKVQFLNRLKVAKQRRLDADHNTKKELAEEKAALSERADKLESDLSGDREKINHLNHAIFEHRQKNAALSRQIEPLKNELRQKTTMLEAKEAQQSEIESQNARLLRKLNHAHDLLRVKGPELLEKKKTLSQVQNDLQQTRSLLRAKEDEVNTLAAQSRQFDTDKAAMEREIETLRAELRALSVGSQTTETRASP
ncbi:hypothetical protein [Endozoicomonas sp. ONNA1]|uniref:hypothetical protein n=1 Tax=Endozoicomonas sp. ONNA1 TaxID=2828740 RepID=UPI002147F5AA|nr:hypothetical protein [Endozoicomonas sp. ONNA1]